MTRIEIKMKTSTTWRTPTFVECCKTFWIKTRSSCNPETQKNYEEKEVLNHTSFGSLHDALKYKRSWDSANGYDGNPEYKTRIVY
jgi:hypothetical protein